MNMVIGLRSKILALIFLRTIILSDQCRVATAFVFYSRDIYASLYIWWRNSFENAFIAMLSHYVRHGALKPDIHTTSSNGDHYLKNTPKRFNVSKSDNLCSVTLLFC